jgi:hypothetical protein
MNAEKKKIFERALVTGIYVGAIVAVIYYLSSYL